MTSFFLAVAIILMFNSFICLYRAVKGPTIQDRIISINIVNTKTLAVLLLVFYISGTPRVYLDIALVYALLNFIVTVALSRYLESEGIELRHHVNQHTDSAP